MKVSSCFLLFSLLLSAAYWQAEADSLRDDNAILLEDNDFYYPETKPPASTVNTATEHMCIQKGYDPDKIYSTDFDRYWTTSSTSAYYLKEDPACESRTSNVRYHYTAHLVPCIFTFHVMSPEDANKTGPNELSDLCGTSNQMIHYGDANISALVDYVNAWPDECVGDYQRCYSVEKDSEVFAKMFCLRHWTIPDGVTHIGVNCTADKNMKLQKLGITRGQKQDEMEGDNVEGISPTQRMCRRRGFDNNKYYDTSHDLSWSATSSYAKRLKRDQGCLSRQSNVQLQYTSHLAPCNVTFHAIPEAEAEEALGTNTLSGLCSLENEHSASTGSSRTILQDFLYNWPDKCVGDFQRCYSVKNNEPIYATGFCHRHWEIPDGVTHIGVDCTSDKTLKLQEIQERGELYPEEASKKEKKNITVTQQMCTRLGYDTNRYDDSYERSWSASSTSISLLKEACPSRQSNIRYHYTAALAPCNFTFHIIPEATTERLGANELSGLCTTKNEYHVSGNTRKVMQDFPYNWPDECVGDYQRCYSLKNDEHTFAHHFCRKHWEIPNGVTHIGVDCTDDKKAKLDRIQEEDSEGGHGSTALTSTQKMCSRLGYSLTHGNDDYGGNREWQASSHLSLLKNNQPCPSRKSNARAHYSANVSPCNITFHSIAEGAQDANSFGPMEFSDMCSSSNEYRTSVSTTLQDYVYNWPDECVGDFQRCYRIEKHEKIFARLFCSKLWTIPEGVTHIGVDCTADKDSKLRQIRDYLEEENEKGTGTVDKSGGQRLGSKGKDGYYAHQEQELREVEATAMAGVLVLVLFCSASMYCTYRHVLKPWLSREMEKGMGTSGLMLDDTENSFEMNSFPGSPESSPPLSPTSLAASPGDKFLKYRLLEKA